MLLAGKIARDGEGTLFAASAHIAPSPERSNSLPAYTGTMPMVVTKVAGSVLGEDIWLGLAFRAPSLFTAFLAVVHDKQRMLPAMLAIIAAHVTGHARV